MDQQLLGLLEKGSLRREAWEIKTIQEISSEIYIGSGVTRSQLGKGNFPTVKCADVNSAFGIWFDKCVSYVNEDDIPRKKYFDKGDILIGKIGDIKTAGRAVAYVGNQRGILGDAVYTLKHDQNPKYLAYVLSTRFCRQQIERLSKVSSVVCLYIRDIKKIKIPLPPRPIQDLIAEVLDKWTHLQEELARELECRKKQYLYYKDRLLSKDIDKWEIKSLGEIATGLYSGSGVTKAQLGTGSHPAVRYSEIHAANLFIQRCKNFVNPDLIKNKKYCETGDLIITNVSENVQQVGKAVAYLGTDKCLIGDHIFLIKHRQNPRFLAYLFSSNYVRKQMESVSRKGIVVEIRKTTLPTFEIPLPPLEEQERIVSLLDPLYEMCGDAEKGIPALIAVIQKQYRYYKEELLRV